jgi:Sulfotransferase family
MIRRAAYRARHRWWPRNGWKGLYGRPVHRVRWALRGREALERYTGRALELDGWFWLFVMGQTNSGTSILTRFLGSHPAVRIMPTEGQYLTDALPMAADYGVKREWTKRLDVFHLTEESDPSPALRARYDWSYYLPHRPGIAVEKSTPNAIRSRWLQANFAPARFVGIVRHPYAVCEGIRRRTGMAIGDAAAQWAQANELMLADSERLDHFLLVTYEDLTERPDEVLAKLQAFLGLDTPFDRTLLESPIAMHNVHDRPQPLQNMNPKSFERLSDEDKAEIDRAAGPMMARLGYA